MQTPVKGSYDCYPAITAAIQACNKAGGGRVTIPKGNWYCAGPIVLLSNVNVHLQAVEHTFISVITRTITPNTALSIVVPTVSYRLRVGKVMTV